MSVTALSVFFPIFVAMKCRLVWLLLLFAVSWLPAWAAGEIPLSTLQASLDEAIDAYQDAVALREKRIARLKQELAAADTSDAAFFRLNGDLYQEYRAYICDSALCCLRASLRRAEQKHLVETADETRLELAFLLSSAGIYQEATEVLKAVVPGRLSPALRCEYYRVSAHLYGELGTYSRDAAFRERYFRLSDVMSDSLLQALSPTSALYLEQKELREAADGHLEEALRINDARMDGVLPDTPEYALVTYHRSQLYRQLGDKEREKYFLMLSALTDVRLAITDHASLWNLAQLLYEEGDVERAYRYIRFSWNETNRYNARSRRLQTASILSLIDLTYQAMREKQNERLRLYLFCISGLVLLLAGALGYIYRQMKHLSATRDRLEHANEQLSMSNHIKEEYIGRFLNLCSMYISRLDSYRRMVNKKLAAGQLEELQKMVRSHDVLAADVKELYDNFDKAFLQLFPDFVEKFNALLLPEERIVLKKGELLNTELRIFALIRLGIDDSSRIAEFLRYSVNTIYNYRAKIKNKAIVSRDDFETKLMEIR